MCDDRCDMIPDVGASCYRLSSGPGASLAGEPASRVNAPMPTVQTYESSIDTRDSTMDSHGFDRDTTCTMK